MEVNDGATATPAVLATLTFGATHHLSSTRGGGGTAATADLAIGAVCVPLVAGPF